MYSSLFTSRLTFIASLPSILLALFLAACGFHLRGHEPLPPQLQTISILSSSPYSPLVKQLEQTFEASHVTVVKKGQQAPILLKILNDDFSRGSSSVGASGQVTTYSLTYNVSFQLLTHDGKPITQAMNVSSTRSYSVSANQVLGDTNVQNNLQEEMQRDVVYQLFNRLRSREVIKALTSTTLSP